MPLPSSGFTSNVIGAKGTDDVRLVVNGQDILIAESWDIHEGILEQPMSWSLQMGSGQTAAQIIQLAPKHSAFQLYVAGALQATGVTEGIRASGGGRTPTAVTIKGRDPLCELYVGHVVAPQSFVNSTYLQMTWRALVAVGLCTGAVPDPKQLATSNSANRIVKAGKKIVEIKPPKSVDEIIQDEDNGSEETATQFSEITARIGDNWLHFLRRYLDPAGLTLWAAADGTFILSEPNVNTSPAYSIIRRAGPNTQGLYGNIISYEFIDDATHRHSYAVAYGRGGGRKAGRAKCEGDEESEDMNAAGWTNRNMNSPDTSRKIAFREASVQNRIQCENYCERKLMEEAREGYQLRYILSGHTLPSFGGSSPTDTTVITTDTIVMVTDEEIGITSPTAFYIESLRRMRKPETCTEIRLMRPSDVSLAYTSSTTPTASPPVQ